MEIDPHRTVHAGRCVSHDRLAIAGAPWKLGGDMEANSGIRARVARASLKSHAICRPRDTSVVTIAQREEPPP